MNSNGSNKRTSLFQTRCVRGIIDVLLLGNDATGRLWGNRWLTLCNHMIINKEGFLKTNSVPACIIGLTLFFTVCAGGGLADDAKLGGYYPSSPTNAEVVAAANFAIRAEQSSMQKNAPSAELILVTIMSAQQQVVSGMNYRMNLKVKLNGTEKVAEAVVWWQAWNQQAPYKLTSWNWK